ncbi:MAG: ATP-binding protein, partial [Saezia sp.]
VLVTSVLVMGLIQIYLSSTYFTEEKEAQLGQVVTGVVTGVQAGQISLDDDSKNSIDLMANMFTSGAFVTDPSGLVIYVTSQAKHMLGEQIPKRIITETNAAGTVKELGRLGGIYKSNFYTVAAPLIGPDSELIGYVFVSSDAAGLKIYLSDMLSSFVLSAIFVLMLSSLVALILYNRTVIPIRRVSEAAKEFAAGNYSARVPVEGDDELAQLALTFNEMANSFEATDLSRRSFMGNIAHELRTPMTSIKGFIDGMLDGTIPEEQRDRYLTIVSDEVGRLARLTKNMLDVSRLEAGEYTPNNTSFDIWSPITSVFFSSEQRITEKILEIEGLSKNKSLYVLADEDFVHQVLFNLIDNAIKFTPNEGKISVQAEASKGFATIQIKNTGSGISQETLPYIFDRFYKEDPSRGINISGSGLGLHICKILLGLMGGRIWVDSKQGEWTEFSFTLPLAPQKWGAQRRFISTDKTIVDE